MAANGTLAVQYFGQKGLYGIKNLNGNEVPEVFKDVFWTHKYMAEDALVKHAEEQRDAAIKRKQTVQPVRGGTGN